MERDAFFAAAWKQCGRREPLRRGVAYPGHDLAQHLDTSLHKLAGTSLRAERPDLWEKLKSFWQLRNQVAHGAVAAQSEIKDRFEKVGSVRAIVSETVVWMRRHPIRRCGCQRIRHFQKHGTTLSCRIGPARLCSLTSSAACLSIRSGTVDVEAGAAIGSTDAIGGVELLPRLSPPGFASFILAAKPALTMPERYAGLLIVFLTRHVEDAFAAINRDVALDDASRAGQHCH